MTCFPLITCHILSLLGNVKKLSREIITSHDGRVKTFFKLSRRRNKILHSNMCLADILLFCTSRNSTMKTSDMRGSVRVLPSSWTSVNGNIR